MSGALLGLVCGAGACAPLAAPGVLAAAREMVTTVTNASAGSTNPAAPQTMVTTITNAGAGSPNPAAPQTMVTTITNEGGGANPPAAGKHVSVAEQGVAVAAVLPEGTGTPGAVSEGRSELPADPATPFLAPEQRVLPWSRQPARWFVSAEFDTGFLYVRPRFSFGYGKPHDTWVGIDTNPIFSVEGVAAYAGLRFDLPFVNLRVGGRRWWTFRRSFLVPEASYTVEDIELREGPDSRFTTWEAELTVNLPIGPGFVLAEGAGSYVTGVADGFFVYEETLRVVVNPPWAWRARLGYTLALDEDETIVVGPVAEVAGVPERGVYVYRAGGLARVALSHDLEARGTFVPAIVTPDALGARGADTFLLGIRYRWATGP